MFIGTNVGENMLRNFIRTIFGENVLRNFTGTVFGENVFKKFLVGYIGIWVSKFSKIYSC